ncbi:hypothetical protein TSTA_082700 [Talaromyces stipitatus ATCC 10500]|uniref:Uncharacterized protein n=1 Tax=Talaromyces stipitatus (strain ATCC 10500 / CBS 375.48 / QM 6759 / NRRL 1006) TaxID=441959 RepID=B8M195_TALSN|nr:uncharacterized protein TSTA_082700 [Talaromyces stipitatus ATCC 10500]EED21037.1 hypothetical protein TSTA_082700 [Talaromyces stipitatus ATCC 10500]
MYHIHFGPHQRKVERYLDEATTGTVLTFKGISIGYHTDSRSLDSVLNDLGQVLRLKASEVGQLSSIFQSHCFTDGEQRYWTEESLKHHIKINHPGIATTEHTNSLLWRCFHFYAYHPFPRHDMHQIDESVFQRAVILLAVQGTDFLGTQDGGDYFWRNDTDFFYDADFRRILRSINPAFPEHKSQPTSQISVVNNVMGVLATTQPYAVTLAPSPDLLESAARRLLDSVPGGNRLRYRLYADDFSGLVTLLLQLRICSQKWGMTLHYGEFFQSSKLLDL